MQVIVVGAGAMGGLFGALLWNAGNDTLLYDTWTEHVDAINTGGLVVESADGALTTYNVPATSVLQPHTIRSADLILLETKTYDTVAALSQFRQILRAGTYVLSLQNGVGNYEEMQRVLPDHERLLIGTTAHGSHVVRPAHVRRTGIGPTEIGDPHPVGGAQFEIDHIAEMFCASGIDMTVTENVNSAVWAKLAANASINPLTALTGIRNGEILEDTQLLLLVEQIVDEMLEVMDAKGIPRAKNDYAGYARFVMEVTWQSYSSMLQDVRLTRRTEIDAINGAIGRFGDELGIPTPANHWITALILNRQRDYLEEDRGVF